MVYLVIAGLVALVFGLILIIAPDNLKEFCKICDHIIMVIDEKIEPHKLWVGTALIVSSAILFYVTRHSALFHPLWIVALFFGLLYLIFPDWLIKLSEKADRVILPTDEYVLGASKVVGSILVMASLIIFFSAFVLVPRSK